MIQPRTVVTALVALTALALFAGTGAAVPTENPGSGAGPGVDAGPGEGAGVSDGGLPVDLPGVVPDFVSSILDVIGGFLQGAIDGLLGPVVSELAGGASAASLTAGA